MIILCFNGCKGSYILYMMVEIQFIQAYFHQVGYVKVPLHVLQGNFHIRLYNDTLIIALVWGCMHQAIESDPRLISETWQMSAWYPQALATPSHPLCPWLNYMYLAGCRVTPFLIFLALLLASPNRPLSSLLDFTRLWPTGEHPVTHS
jgi:hypothetical protein